MEITKKERTKDILLMLLTALLWSLGGVLVKSVPWSALSIAGVRSVIAATFIGAYMAVRGYRFVVNRRTCLIMLGLTCTYIPFVLATKLTTAANAIVIQYAAPLFVLLYNCIFKRQKLFAADALAVLFTTLGVAICFLDSLGGGSTIGNIIALFSGVGFAVTLLATEGGTNAERVSGLMLGQALTACIGLPFFFIERPPVTAPAVLCLLALGILQIGLSYVLYSIAAGTCPPLACALLSAVEPLLNPVWVALFNGEMPGRLSLLGGIVVIASVTVWCVWSSKHAAKNHVAQAQST